MYSGRLRDANANASSFDVSTRASATGTGRPAEPHNGHSRAS